MQVEKIHFRQQPVSCCQLPAECNTNLARNIGTKQIQFLLYRLYQMKGDANFPIGE
jgi:hypothetical protein